MGNIGKENWIIPKIWQDEEVWILGGGPSLSRQFEIPEEIIQQVEKGKLPVSCFSPYMKDIHDKPVIGVNMAFKLGDFVDMVVWGDPSFYRMKNVSQQLSRFTGYKVTAHESFNNPIMRKEGILTVKKDARKTGISNDPKTVCWNLNSGGLAINIAVHAGAKRIILVGFDMHSSPSHSHWHNEYGKPTKPPFQNHLKGFDQIAKDAEERGVEIINACPDSAIPYFPKTTVKDLISLKSTITVDTDVERSEGALHKYRTLSYFHKVLKPEVYLEIGVENGTSLKLSNAEINIGIDPKPRIKSNVIYEQTSDNFFQQHTLVQKPDLVFIDGMHLIENVLSDFINVEKNSKKNTVILIDDVAPAHPVQANRIRQSKKWAGDVWKIVPILRQYRPDLSIKLLDVAPTGMIMVTGLNPDDKTLSENYDAIVDKWKHVVVPLSDVLREGAYSDFTFLDDYQVEIKESKDNKIVIYTAITNGYDKLHDPPVIDGVDYICFSDHEIDSDVWEVKVIDDIDRVDKFVKIKPHLFLQDYDVSIWIDASVRINKNIFDLITESIQEGDLIVFKHPKNNTLKQEVDDCIKLRKADEDKLYTQLNAYKGYEEKEVCACGFIIRRHNNIQIINLMEQWWDEIQKHTYRDQISFCYLINKMEAEYFVIEDNIFSNQWFFVEKKHLKKIKYPNKIKVGVVTPTCSPERKPFLDFLDKTISKQTKKPHKWIKVDFEKTDSKPDIAKRIKYGVKQAFEAGCTLVLFMEDDDFYPLTYIETMVNKWKENGYPTIIGVRNSMYYHLKVCKFLEFNRTKHCALFSTGVGRNINIQTIPDDADAVDIKLWKQNPGGVFVDLKNGFIPLGIKHGVGESGGDFHDPKRFNQNNGYRLEDFLNNEALDFYKEISRSLIKTKDSNKIKVGVVTPTCSPERKPFLDFLHKRMKQQTRQPDVWIKKDYPNKTDRPDIAKRFKEGIREAFEQGCDFVLLMEDDDFYPTTYIQDMVEAWVKNDYPKLMGVGTTIYYHLKVQRFKQMKPAHCSAFCTAVAPGIKLDVCGDYISFFDIKLWKFNRKNGIQIELPKKRMPVGIKHGIGKSGGNMHDPNRYHENGYNFTIEDFVDEEALEFYKTIKL